MSSILHLIWVGKLREEEIDTARALLYAARLHKTRINFFVDDVSKNSIVSLLNGTLQSQRMNKNNIDSGVDFFKSAAVKIINIDEDLEAFIQQFIELPAVKKALKEIFPIYNEADVNQFIRLMIQLEHVGPGRNLAALSDILRAIAIIIDGGFYADLDVKLKRSLETFGFFGNLTHPLHFKINLTGNNYNLLNNDIISAPAQDPVYIQIFCHFAKQYFYHIAADFLFYNPKGKFQEKSKILNHIAKNYISRFTHKRHFDRFHETHKITGNIAISDIVSEKCFLGEKYSLQGTIFSNAESVSEISWQSKRKHSDDSNFRYSLSIRAKPLDSFIKNNFDSNAFISLYLKFLFDNSKSQQIIELKMIDYQAINELTSKVLIDLEKDFMLAADGIRIFYSSHEKELSYSDGVCC